MKVEIYRLVEQKIEATIPTRCPSCKADFIKEEGALVEDQYIASGQSCQISEEGTTIDNYGDSDDFPEAQYVVGYRCQCGHVLASTEGSDSTVAVAS